MSKWALIENGLVNTVSYIPVDGWEEVSDDVFGGFTQNEDGTFTAPVAPVQPTAPVTFTPRQFIETLFTPAEQQAIYTAAQGSWQISMFISLVTASPFINLSDPELIKDIGTVQAAGLLTAPRAAQILAGTPPT